MSTTARDIFEASMRMIGALASGETATDAEATDGLKTLNRLLDSWSNEELLIPSRVRDVLALTGGQETYTLGTGGNWNTARPIQIDNALLQITSQTPNLELQLRIVDQDEYAALPLKALTSTYPMYLYDDGAYPLRSVSLFPVPAATGNNIVLYSWKPLSQLSTLSTALSFQPGFERMMIFNLAIDLAAEYGKAVPETVATLAIESKAVLKRVNARPALLRVDSALRARTGVYDWRSDSYPGGR